MLGKTNKLFVSWQKIKQSLKSHKADSLPGGYACENIVVGVMRENFPEEGVERAGAAD